VPETVTSLLDSLPERKLVKLRAGIAQEIGRLTVELRMVDEALTRKHSGIAGADEKLTRTDLLAHVAATGRPVKPAEMQQILAAKGIVRTPEAVRVSLTRLVKDGKLVRTEDGLFAVLGRTGSKN
jgi:hypothetical protein